MRSASEVSLNEPFELRRYTDNPVPVVQGGMQWVGYAELASAVSNAGGLGIVSQTYSLFVPPDADIV